MSTELLRLNTFYIYAKPLRCIFHRIVSMKLTTHISLLEDIFISFNCLVELDKVIYHTLLYLVFCSIFQEKSTYVRLILHYFQFDRMSTHWPRVQICPPSKSSFSTPYHILFQNHVLMCFSLHHILSLKYMLPFYIDLMTSWTLQSLQTMACLSLCTINIDANLHTLKCLFVMRYVLF